MHRHFIHAEKQLLVGTGSAAARQPLGGIQDRIPEPRNMQEGQSKAESSGLGPPQGQGSPLAPLGLTGTRGILGDSPWSPAAGGAAPPAQPRVAKHRTLQFCLGQLLHHREATHLMDQVRDLVFSPLLSCGLISFFLESRKR